MVGEGGGRLKRPQACQACHGDHTRAQGQGIPEQNPNGQWIPFSKGWQLDSASAEQLHLGQGTGAWQLRQRRRAIWAK